MCRLCKDWKYVGNSATRWSPADARAMDEHEVPPPQRRKKNTRRWCKGVEGREHVLEVIETDQSWTKGRAHFVDRCVNCGKHLNDFWVWIAPKPEWYRKLEERKIA